MSQINVVPFIDVVLVLLIIFMITAPLIQQGVEVELPQASANPLPPDTDEPVVVSVDKKGRFFLDIGDEPRKPIDARNLVNRVAAVRSLKPKVPVLVRGDRNVDYGRVIDVMVLLQQAGIEKVGLMTDQTDK
jgi:biopolymer transport protein TolR